jgi:predicted P-loop ATPase
VIHITRFRHERDSSPQGTRISWPDLARELTTHDFTHTAKKGLPCFSPAEFVAGAPTKQARYVLRCHFGVIDLDDVTSDEIVRVAAATDGLASCWYTSWSHPEAAKQGLARLRVVVPFSRPVEVREWESFWPRMVQRLGGICDAKCSDASRIYFGPYMPAGTEALAFTHTSDGEPLDVEAVLAITAPVKGPKATRPVDRETLRRLAKKWQKSASTEKQDLGERLGQVADGVAYADAGSRDDCTWRLVCALSKALPQAEPDSLAELFGPSVDLMGEPSRDSVREKFVRVFGESTYVASLVRGDGGKPLGTLGNAITVLEHHRDMAGLVGWNERSMRVVLRRPPPWDIGGTYPREMRDDDGSRLSQWLGVLDVQVSGAVATEALVSASKLHSFDPFVDWLNGLAWDGRERLDAWLVRYAGAADSPYVRSVGAKWVISAVARAYVPGAKVDTMLILEGDQGARKSTLLNALVGDDYFGDSLGDISNKDSCLQLQGPVVIEIAELESFDRREAEAVKAFLARRYDRFRAPYGRVVQEHPRRVIIAGSTNEEHYLKDRTGHRRFWPVACGECDPAGVVAVRAQLWAEAVVRYRAGEQWWLTPDENEMAKAEQEGREAGDPWDAVVGAAIAKDATEVRVPELLSDALMIPVGLQTRAHEMRLGTVLRRLGWARRQVWDGRKNARVWCKG